MKNDNEINLSLNSLVDPWNFRSSLVSFDSSICLPNDHSETLTNSGPIQQSGGSNLNSDVLKSPPTPPPRQFAKHSTTSTINLENQKAKISDRPTIIGTESNTNEVFGNLVGMFLGAIFSFFMIFVIHLYSKQYIFICL